jgi:hypothetical protein
MRNHRSLIGTLPALALLAGVLWPRAAVPQAPPDPARAPVLQYVGAKGCASCHKSKATGNQFEVWQASAHARAYQTLATPEAKAIAVKLGLDKEPQQAPRCLVCHTTAAGESRGRIAESFDVTQGVQCEACHGPGSEYSKIQHMIKLESAVNLGLRHPDAKACKKCHNEESPTYKRFDYAAGLKKIEHRLAPL